MLFIVDFDGMVTCTDTVDLLLKKFAEPHWRFIEAQWAAGRIDSRECMQRQMALVKIDLPQFQEYTRTIAVDPDFAAFVETVSGWADVAIVSDGLDFTIRQVLDTHTLPHLPVYANRLEFVDGGLDISFPHGSAECEQHSGVCKCAVMRSLNKNGRQRSVLIGDGRSDHCLARHADIVFAKGSLQTYCKDEGIAYLPVDAFSDVVSAIRNWNAPRPDHHLRAYL